MITCDFFRNNPGDDGSGGSTCVNLYVVMGPGGENQNRFKAQNTLYERVLLCLILLACVVMGIYRIIVVLPSRIHQNDFAHYYVSSESLLRGKNPYQVDFKEAYKTHNFVFDERIYGATNPPTLIWLFSPLVYLTPSHAFWTWMVIQSLSLIGIFWLLGRLLQDKLQTKTWWLICGVLLISLPLHYNYYFSQVQLLLLALVLMAYLLKKRGWNQLALVCVVVAGMIKIYPLVLVPWFIWRSTGNCWRRVFYTMEALLLGSAIVYATKPDLWVSFLGTSLQIIRENVINQTSNYSLPSLIVNSAYALYNFQPPPSFGPLFFTVSVFSGIAVILAGYVIICFDGYRRNYDLQFSILCTAMIIGNITSWGHYLVFLIFPVSTGILSSLHKTSAEQILYVVIAGTLTLAGAEHLLMRGNLLFNVFIHYVPLYAMLLLFVLLSRTLLSLTRAPVNSTAPSESATL